MENVDKIIKAFEGKRFVGVFYSPETGRGGVISDGSSVDLMNMVSTLLSEIPKDAADMAVKVYQRTKS